MEEEVLMNNLRDGVAKDVIDELISTLIRLGLQKPFTSYKEEIKPHLFVENFDVRLGIAETNRLLRKLIKLIEDGGADE